MVVRIKLRGMSSGHDPLALEFYERFEQDLCLTHASPDFQIARNPFDPRFFTVVDKDLRAPIGQLELSFFNDAIRLSAIELKPEFRGEGRGAKLLQLVVGLADQHMLDIEASIDPIGKKPGDGQMGVRELRRFYLKHGFKQKPGYSSREIIRETGTPSNELNAPSL